MGGETTNDTVILQTLRGQVRIAVDGMDIPLGPGQLTTIEDPSAWRLVAETEALLLIMAAHPDGFVGASD